MAPARCMPRRALEVFSTWSSAELWSIQTANTVNDDIGYPMLDPLADLVLHTHFPCEACLVPVTGLDKRVESSAFLQLISVGEPFVVALNFLSGRKKVCIH